MSKQVHYHQHGREPLVLHVVKDHENGKFDLARTADGPAIITEICVGEEIGDGKATSVEVAKAKKAKGKKEAEKVAPEGDAKEDTESDDRPPPEE